MVSIGQRRAIQTKPYIFQPLYIYNIQGVDETNVKEVKNELVTTTSRDVFTLVHVFP